MINKRKRNKHISAFLALVIIIETIAGIFIPYKLSLNPPHVLDQNAQAVGENWFNTGGTWTKRKAITITENSGSTLTNYQVKITVVYDSDMQADFDDIRFTSSDGSTLIDHWLESKTDSSTADFWVEVPNITASSTATVYMYYGNVGAISASNEANTFLFFDDFSGNLSKWNVAGATGSWSISGGELYLSSGAGAVIKPNEGSTWGNDGVNIGYEVQVKMRRPSASSNNAFNFSVFSQGADSAYSDGYGLSASDSSLAWYNFYGPPSYGYLILNQTFDQNHNLTWWTKMRAYNTGSATVIYFWRSNDGATWFLDTQYTSYSDSSADRHTYGKIALVSYDGVAIYFDDVRVRKYASSEPSPSLGSEEFLNYLAVTGTATMNAGASQVVTVTAKTNMGNTYAAYTGDKSLTFSGPSVSGGGNNPTCTDKNSADVNFGTTTTITFTNGVGTCTMKLYAAESVSVDVTDGTTSSAADASYDLDIVVSSPISAASIQINSNDAYTTAAGATLTLAATNASQMKFSNDNIAYSAYEAYGVSKSWDITNVTYGGTSSDGTKTVYVKYKDSYGNEAAAINDNIVYDTTSPVNPTAAVDAQGAASDTWQNNKNDPNFTSFTGESDTNGVAGFDVYFGTDSVGVTTDWIATDAYNPVSFLTSNARYLRVIAKDNAGLWADPDAGGATCTNTNASRPADPDCWATIFIHKYDINAPNTPSPSSLPVSWTNTNSFNFSWSDPGDVGGSGVKDYTYQTNAGTSPTTTSGISVNGLTSDANGTKLFSVKANDNAGNSGSDGTVNFYFDDTLPVNAGAATDGNGALDDTWGAASDPNFTWIAGTDLGDQSGVKEYDVYWGTSSTGTTVTATVASNAYNPSAIPTNTPYYLRIRTRDNAGNISAWATKFTMKYSQSPSAPSGLSQTANSASLAFGEWTSDTTPTMNFTLSDPDSDTLGYIIKIDDSLDFSSLIAHYTYSANDLVSGAEYSFTVGQAAGTGAYTVGSAGQTLAEGQYYWKVQAVESHGLTSSEVTANSGAIAFGIDTSNPIGTTLGFGTIATDSIGLSVSGAADAVSGLHATPYYFENTTASTNSGWQAAASWNSGSLSANTQYTFRVTSRDKAGNTHATVTQNKYTLASQVAGLAVANATDKNNYKINLTWTNQGQSGMKIERDTNCDGYETTLYDNANVNAASPYSATLTANTCYKFRVLSYNGDGAVNSGAIPETSQITTPPGQPLNLVHTANTTNSITWDWDDVSAAAGYKIYRLSDDQLLATIGTATSTWLQDTLSADAQYTIYVRATNANGESIASSSSSAYTSANAPVSASHSANTPSSINWTWATGGTQKDYYASNSSPADNSGWTASAYWTQNSLSANTQYTFSVKARNEDLDETNSTSGSAYTSQGNPSGISFGAVTASSITVSDAGFFSNLSQGSSGLYFLNTTNSDTAGWVQTNSWTNSLLLPNTQYSYKAKARNGDGEETSYTAESVKYTLANAPSAPMANNALPTTIDVNVNVNSNPAATQFAVYKETGVSCDGAGGSYIAANGSDNGATAVWQTDAEWGTTSAIGLAENTQYSFCVKARNGESVETGFSASESATTTASNLAPNAPVLVSPSSGSYTSDNTPVLSASYADLDVGDIGTTNYRISSTSALDCNNNLNIAAFGASNATATNSENTVWSPTLSIGSNGTYYWCAQNSDGALSSSWISMGNLILDTAGPSGTALDFGAIATDSITVTVSGAADSGSGLAATPYYFENITASTNSGWQAASSWSSASLTPNTQYDFRVKSKDALSNESSFTSSQSKYTLAAVPSSLSLVADSQTQITVSWNANFNSVGTLYYAENITAGTNSGWTNGTSWISLGLSCNTSHSFRVKAKNGDGVETDFVYADKTTDSCSTSPAASTSGISLPPSAFDSPSAPNRNVSDLEETFSVFINDNAVYSNGANVKLSFVAGENTARMSVSDFSDFRNASQIPYQTEMKWELPPVSGEELSFLGGVEKTVYVKFFTQYGVSSQIFSDSIIVDAIPPEIKIAGLKDSYPEKEDIMIFGLSEPGSKIVPRLNGEYVSSEFIVADFSGNWAFNLGKLKAGKYSLELKAKDLAENIGPTLTRSFEVGLGMELGEPSSSMPIAPPILENSDKIESVNEDKNVTPEETPVLQSEPAQPGPYPENISLFIEKFPSLENSFKNLDLSDMESLEKFENASLAIPNLSEVLKLNNIGVSFETANPNGAISLSNLSSEIKKSIPSDVIFAQTAKEKIDLSPVISLDLDKNLIEKYSAISRQSLSLILKPESPAKGIRGYVVFNSKFKAESSKSDSKYSEFGKISIAKILGAGNYVHAQESEKIRLVLSKFDYSDADNDGIWIAEINAPEAAGDYEISSVIDYKDQSASTKEIKTLMVVDSESYVFEKTGENETRISNAIITIYRFDSQTEKYELWSAEDFSQQNPQITDKTGSYAFLVPEGKYYIKAEAAGYVVYQSDPFEMARSGGVRMDLEMKKEKDWRNAFSREGIILILLGIVIAAIVAGIKNYKRNRQTN